MRMIHDKNGEAKGYIKMLLRKYKKREMSFNDFVEETKAVESFVDNLLLDNIKVFKDRVRNNILSWAVLDGGIFYCFETTQKYLDAGLSRRVLIRWLKKNLPYEYGIGDGAEDEDIDYDFVVLELCQLLRKYRFTVRTVESILDQLSDDARTFFLMNTLQRNEWSLIGINPDKYKDRCLKYPVEKWNPDFHLRFEPCDLEKIPSDLREVFVKEMVASDCFKSEDFMKIAVCQDDVLRFLTSYGIEKKDLVEKFRKDVGLKYKKYSSTQLAYALCLFPDMGKYLDEATLWMLYDRMQPPNYVFEDLCQD